MSFNKIKVDFQVINTDDPKVLVIADTSEWGVIKDTPTIIEVTTPGSRNPITNYYDQGEFNILNSATLGINCGAKCKEDLVDLPDGVYKIKVIGSPEKYNKERYYFRNEKLKLRLAEVYIKLGRDIKQGNKQEAEMLWIAELLIKASESATKLGYIGEASDFYMQASKIVKNSLNCCK